MLTRCTERLLGYIKLIPHWRVYKICLYRELYLWQQDIITLITNLCRLFWYLQSQLIPHPQVITHPNMGQRDAEVDWVTAVSLLLWSLRSCPLGGFLHLGSVLFVGVTGRFPHTLQASDRSTAVPVFHLRLPEVAVMSTVWIESYFFYPAGVCDHRLLWLTSSGA